MCIRANIPLLPEEAIMAMEDDMNNEEMQLISKDRAIFNGQRMCNHLVAQSANN